MMSCSAAGPVPGERERSVRSAPHHLPAQVGYLGRGRHGAVPQVAVIRRDVVAIRRECEAGVPLYISVPVRNFRGVVLSGRFEDGRKLSIRLEHGNRDLRIPLSEHADPEAALQEWRAWGEALCCPLLLEDAAGEVTEAEPGPAPLAVQPPRARRANTFFRERRPRFLTRRRVGGVATGPVLREDEIIARSVDD